MKKHYPIKNKIGGEYCKKCLHWSNMVGGLSGCECKATRKEWKENINILKATPQAHNVGE